MSLQYQPFQLLRLPYLASCEIIRNMGLRELIVTAVQSKRAKRLIKASTRINHVNLDFDGFFMRIQHDYRSVLEIPTNMEQDTRSFERVVDFLMDILKSLTFSIELVANGSTRGILNILETVKMLKIKRMSVAVGLVYMDNVYRTVLHDFQNLEELKIEGRVSLDFLYPFPSERDFKLVQLKLEAPVEHIAYVYQNCQRLELDGPYNDTDVHYLLNRWRTKYAWEHVTIKNKSDSLSTVLSDIEHEPVAKANLDGSIQRFYFDTCAVIKHYYGIRALVFLDRKNSVLILSTDFNLDVEPEDNLEENEENTHDEEVGEEDLGQQGQEQEIREEEELEEVNVAEEVDAGIHMMVDQLDNQLIRLNPERWPELHQQMLHIIENGRRYLNLRRQRREEEADE